MGKTRQGSGRQKSVGAAKKRLIGQFIGEALFMAILATILAAVIIALLLPAFNGLVNKSLSLQLGNPVHLLELLLIAVLCGLVTRQLSRPVSFVIPPGICFKGHPHQTGSAAAIRKGLVVFQFSISIVLIIATLIIYQQIKHVKSRNLGFNKENLLELDVQGVMGTHFDVIRQDLMNTNVVRSAALSDHATIYGGNNTDGFTWEGKYPNSRVLISTRYVSPEFFATSGMHVLDGRDIRIGDTMAAHRINVVITRLPGKNAGEGKPGQANIYGFRAIRRTRRTWWAW